MDEVRFGTYAEAMTNPETQLASYFSAYEPAMAEFGKARRAKMRARLPGLFEIVDVYQSQNALVISYSPTGQGARLSKSDPNKLLQMKRARRAAEAERPASAPRSAKARR